MRQTVPYVAFGNPRTVSVWIGDFRTAEELDEYLCLSQEFERDFGFSLSDRNMPETTVESQPTSIEKMVSGFSWSESFRDAVAEAARWGGVSAATTMLVFHNFEYDPALVKVAANPRLRFLGAFPFES
jgi:hypothetical protein